MNAANSIDVDISANSRETLVLRLQAYMKIAEQLYIERKSMSATSNSAAEAVIDPGK